MTDNYPFTNERLKLFYIELRDLLNKHDLVMYSYREFDGRDEYIGRSFTLRSKTYDEETGVYEVYTDNLEEFTIMGSE